jgi:hypothetical protein
MANKFTQKAQNSLNLALTAARDLGHTYVGSEHLLLGLLLEKDSIASRLLLARGATAERIRKDVVDVAGIGSPGHVSPSDMTPRVKTILEVSAAESARCGNRYIGTEHLLFAMLNERDCMGVRLLESIGIPVFAGASQGGTLSFTPTTDCEEFAQKLADRGIAVRAGLHCAPLAHQSAGTFPSGTVRLSFGHDADGNQTGRFLKILENCLEKVKKL